MPKTLGVGDIIGAQPNTKGLGVFEFAKRQNDPFSQNLISTDIYGAQPGSLKKGIVTDRKLHPLDPKYQFPGHSELETKNPFSMTKKEKEAEARRAIQSTGQQVLSGQSAAVHKREQSPSSDAQKLDSFICNK